MFLKLASSVLLTALAWLSIVHSTQAIENKQNERYVGEVQFRLGRAAYDKGNYNEAEKHFLISLNEVQGSHPDWLRECQILDWLTSAYTAQHRYKQAEETQRRSLAKWEEVQGRDALPIVSHLDTLADLCIKQSKFTEAESFYKRSLAICEKACPDVAGLEVSNLAKLYIDQKKYPEAESFYKRAIKLEEKVLEPRPAENCFPEKFKTELFQGRRDILAKTMSDYAQLLRIANRQEEAEHLEAQARILKAKQN